MTQNDRGAKEKWWQFIRPRPELQAAIANLERVLVAGSQASTQYAITFLPRGLVYSSNLSVIAFETYAGFAARLLELNAERAKEEARSGAARAAKRTIKAPKKRASKPSNTGRLFS